MRVWDQFLPTVPPYPPPPADIPITPAPSPQEVACKAGQDNPPEQLSFSDREHALQYRDAGTACNKDPAERVRQATIKPPENASGERGGARLPAATRTAAAAK